MVAIVVVDFPGHHCSLDISLGCASNLCTGASSALAETREERLARLDRLRKEIPKRFGIVTPYSAQVSYIQQRLRVVLEGTDIGLPQVSSVDGFQARGRRP